MISIGTYEAKTHFGQFVERASKGEEFLITKNGKPVAAIVPAPQARTMKSPEEAMRDILELGEEIRKRKRGKLLRKGETWRDLIHAGHRY